MVLKKLKGHNCPISLCSNLISLYYFWRLITENPIAPSNGSTIAKKEGDYGHHKSIYQEFVDYPKDENGLYYQAGVFFAYEPCGLSYRRGDIILDDDSKFIGHIIK